MSIFSIIWAVKEDLESTAHDTMGPLSVLSTGNRTQDFLWETGKELLEPAAISLNKSPPTTDLSPLPTYRHPSSRSPTSAHRVEKPRRAAVEELLSRRSDELPGGTGRCLSVSPSTTPPLLEIHHLHILLCRWPAVCGGCGRRQADRREVVSGDGTVVAGAGGTVVVGPGRRPRSAPRLCQPFSERGTEAIRSSSEMRKIN
uniref:Uncharacterized protein n=1 Tax=Oryza meridionalis TaxID=40149 RepID=A0A0E0D5W4_9ORYZ